MTDNSDFVQTIHCGTLLSVMGLVMMASCSGSSLSAHQSTTEMKSMQKNKSETSFIMVTTTDRGSCGATTDNELICWGIENWKYQLNREIDQLEGVADVVCSLYVDGQTVCQSFGSEDVRHEFDLEMREISVGPTPLFDRFAGISGEGQIVEIRGPSWEIYEITEDGSGYSSVTAPHGGICWLDDEQSVECEENAGIDVEEQLLQDRYFEMIDCAAYYCCGIEDSGAVQCWGEDPEETLDLEIGRKTGVLSSPAGEFTELSVGVAHVCGITREQELKCWGVDDYGLTDPPEGEFVSIAASATHNCAIDVHHGVECWGINEHGQTDPPK